MLISVCCMWFLAYLIKGRKNEQEPTPIFDKIK
jgi:hypothetical protein